VNPTNTVAGRRRTHFDAFGTPPDTYGIAVPPSIRRRLCSVYAVEVQVGDILKYGNALNDGCKVTEADLRGQALSTEGDTNDDYEETIQVRDAPPVNLNGTVRIQWETKDGQSKLSQYFAGLEKLEVLRVIGKRGNREE